MAWYLKVWKHKKAILIGCAAAVLLPVVLPVIILQLFFPILNEMEGVSVSVNAQSDVIVGDTFVLAVDIKNTREKKFLLRDIDIVNYLAGFTIISIEPAPKSKGHMTTSFHDNQIHTFKVPIPAEETKTFTFKLRAETAGTFRGTIEVYGDVNVDGFGGMWVIKTMVQTVVENK
jgi:hypothetical protein